VPALFVAVTFTRIAWPTSAAVRRNVAPPAPGTALQAAPLWSHLCHSYAYVIGVVPPQEPLEAVSVWPLRAVPAIFGSAAFWGGEAARTADPAPCAATSPRASPTTPRTPRARSVNIALPPIGGRNRHSPGRRNARVFRVRIRSSSRHRTVLAGGE